MIFYFNGKGELICSADETSIIFGDKFMVTQFQKQTSFIILNNWMDSNDL